MDKNAAVIADVMLINKKKAAEDVTFELPSVAFQTADVAAMGTLSIPLVGLLDDMTMTITKVGVDKGYGTMITPEKLAIEFRWVQDVVNGDGSVTQGLQGVYQCDPSGDPESLSRNRIVHRGAAYLYSHQIPACCRRKRDAPG